MNLYCIIYNSFREVKSLIVSKKRRFQLMRLRLFDVDYQF